jgi:hypothetical protein
MLFFVVAAVEVTVAVELGVRVGRSVEVAADVGVDDAVGDAFGVLVRVRLRTAIEETSRVEGTPVSAAATIGETTIVKVTTIKRHTQAIVLTFGESGPGLKKFLNTSVLYLVLLFSGKRATRTRPPGREAPCGVGGHRASSRQSDRNESERY